MFHSFKKLFLASSLLLAVSSLISRLLGVYRDHLFAKHFGASAMLDAYFAAFRIPDLLYALLIVSSISVVFLPVFQKYKEKNNMKEAWRFTSRVLNSLVGLFLILSALVIFFTPQIVDIYVSGFNAEQKELTVKMMRIMMLSPFFFMLASLMISVQQAFHVFIAQALAPIFYNIGILVGILFFSSYYGVYGIALGVVLGACMQMLLQIPFFFKTGFSWSFSFLKGQELKEMLKILTPRILSVSAVQVALTVDTILAASLTAGSITLLTLAANIQSLPFGMISISIAITTFAHLTQSVAKGDMKAFKSHLQKNMEKTLFWLMPALAGVALIAKPLVSFLFEHGAFSSGDSEQLIRLLYIFLIALFFQGFIPLLARSFFALQKTWLAFFVSTFALMVNIIASIY
ncbi:murein biosynthesis integral membrane protein MurJ, partial [Candidatus Peregrinibacteria bacterium]|nr:murein biosynthesis integral membrane protein MurJ [Candidatus Peregrinibacteria bacterium]